MTTDDDVRRALLELGTLAGRASPRTAALPLPLPHGTRQWLPTIAPVAAGLVAAGVVLVVTVGVPYGVRLTGTSGPDDDRGVVVAAPQQGALPQSALPQGAPAQGAPAQVTAPQDTAPQVEPPPVEPPPVTSSTATAAPAARSGARTTPVPPGMPPRTPPPAAPTAAPTSSGRSTATGTPHPPWQQDYSTRVTSTTDPGSAVMTVRATVSGRTLSVWFWATGPDSPRPGTTCLRVTAGGRTTRVPLARIALSMDTGANVQGTMTFEAVPDGTVDLVYACDAAYPPGRLGVLG